MGPSARKIQVLVWYCALQLVMNLTKGKKSFAMSYNFEGNVQCDRQRPLKVNTITFALKLFNTASIKREIESVFSYLLLLGTVLHPQIFPMYYMNLLSILPTQKSQCPFKVCRYSWKGCHYPIWQVYPASMHRVHFNTNIVNWTLPNISHH